jgi:hypothetical protein
VVQELCAALIFEPSDLEFALSTSPRREQKCDPILMLLQSGVIAKMGQESTYVLKTAFNTTKDDPKTTGTSSRVDKETKTPRPEP